MNIIELVKFARQKKKENNRTVIAEVDAKTVAVILAKGGIDINGFIYSVDTSAVRHVFNKHGLFFNEAARGQVAIIEEDFKKLERIVIEYDTIIVEDKSRSGLDIIKYIKEIKELNYFVVMEVRKGKKQLALLTMYKKPLKPKGLSGKNFNKSDG